jgi:hypothetical protein
MNQAILKIQKNKNITLPVWLIKKFHVMMGDYVRIEETKTGVLLKPAKLIDPTQAYFWTKEWQSSENQVNEEIRMGKVKKAKSVEALMKELNAR